MENRTPLIGSSQMQILQQLWKHGRLSIVEIVRCIADDPGARLITRDSAERIIRLLHRRRLVRQHPREPTHTHDSLGRAVPAVQTYTAAVPRREYEHTLAVWFLSTYFRNDLCAFQAALQPLEPEGVCDVNA